MKRPFAVGDRVRVSGIIARNDGKPWGSVMDQKDMTVDARIVELGTIHVKDDYGCVYSANEKQCRLLKKKPKPLKIECEVEWSNAYVGRIETCFGVGLHSVLGKRGTLTFVESPADSKMTYHTVETAREEG